MSEERTELECAYFKYYQGIVRPTCSCIKCRDKYIDKLENQLVEAREKHRWIPVSERLPEERVEVLTYLPNLHDEFSPAADYLDVSYRHEGLWRSENLDKENVAEFITHWQPLPDPPTENTASKGKEGGE